MVLVAAMFLLFAGSAQTQSPLLGDWVTPSHSIVRVFPCKDSDLCVRIVKVGPKNEPQVDVNNPNAAEHNRPLCGMVIGEGFKLDGATHAKDGHIYDPESGKTYSGEMTRDGSELKLRGYVGISLFGRTETWHRDHSNVPAC